MPFSVQRTELRAMWAIFILAFGFLIFWGNVAVLLQALHVEQMTTMWTLAPRIQKQSGLCLLIPTKDTHTYEVLHALWYCVVSVCCGLFAFALNRIPYLHRTLTYANIFLLHFCVAPLTTSLALWAMQSALFRSKTTIKSSNSSSSSIVSSAM